jgi:hypothetical protein
MSPEEYFNELLANLNLSSQEIDQISKKHLSLRERLRELLPITDDFLTGSYPRNTIIRPIGQDKFDVDFFLVFSNDTFGAYELPKLLEVVKIALEKIRDEDSDIVKIQQQNRSIGIEYRGNFQIDVVPAIEIEKDRLYKIFDKKTRQPIDSNPLLHGKHLSEVNRNTECNSVKRLVPIIKLLKSWKREKCDYVKSFHLELLAVEILQENLITSFSSGITRFFSSGMNYLQDVSLVDPTNTENLIDEYLDNDGVRGQLLELIAKEREIAENALYLEEVGEKEKAISEWKKIFSWGDDSKNVATSLIPRVPTIITTPPKQHCNVPIKHN